MQTGQKTDGAVITQLAARSSLLTSTRILTWPQKLPRPGKDLGLPSTPPCTSSKTPLEAASEAGEDSLALDRVRRQIRELRPPRRVPTTSPSSSIKLKSSRAAQEELMPSRATKEPTELICTEAIGRGVTRGTSLKVKISRPRLPNITRKLQRVAIVEYQMLA